MKKFLAFAAIFLLLLCLPACGNASKPFGITMEQVVEANRTETLLENHGSFKVTVSDGLEPYEYYVDRELAYEGFSDYQAITTEDSYYYIEGGAYYRVLYAGVELDHSWYEQLFLDEESCLAEEILEVEQEGDVILMKTKLPQEVFADFFSEADREKLESLSIEYKLDAETYSILSFTQLALFTDGSLAQLITTADYGASRPDMADDLYARTTQTENVRTVTVVLDPLTDAEASYSVTVPTGGDNVAIYCSEAYSGGMYLDPECTENYFGEVDYESDMTLYIPAVETD